MGTFRVRVEIGDPPPPLVVFGDPDTLPLLGAYALEGFGLAPDPVNRRLIPVPGLLVLAISLVHAPHFSRS